MLATSHPQEPAQARDTPPVGAGHARDNPPAGAAHARDTPPVGAGHARDPGRTHAPRSLNARASHGSAYPASVRR